MKIAMELALKAKEKAEVPVGALIVYEGVLVGSGYNQVISSSNPCAHAEILAIQEAGLKLGNYRLVNSTMYSTLEPCAMCAGAIVHARIKRLVFACRDLKAGAAGSVFNLLSGFPLNHKVEVAEGLMQEECAELLKGFFRERRLKA